MTLQTSGEILGTAIANALAPTPPVPPPQPWQTTKPVMPPNATAAQIATFQAETSAYSAYQSYQNQLTSYQAVSSGQKATFITIANQILTYLVNNSTILPSDMDDGYGRQVTGYGSLT